MSLEKIYGHLTYHRLRSGHIILVLQPPAFHPTAAAISKWRKQKILQIHATVRLPEMAHPWGWFRLSPQGEYWWRAPTSGCPLGSASSLLLEVWRERGRVAQGPPNSWLLHPQKAVHVWSGIYCFAALLTLRPPDLSVMSAVHCPSRLCTWISKQTWLRQKLRCTDFVGRLWAMQRSAKCC